MTENRQDEALGFEAFELPPDPADDFEWVPATPEVAGELAEPPEADWWAAGTSRRAFLRGVVCSGVAVSASAYMFTVQSGEARAAVRGVERLISLNVNGKTRRVDVPPSETLAQTIRYRLGLTGTKIGCNRAECGACTVLADDTPIYSCSTLTHQARGKKIVTVEGVAAPDGTLHPVQQAFIDELGPQCGFCTPGQVMAAVGLLKKNPKPTVDEARRAMSGNLCRCGAYPHYLAGVMRAAERAWVMAYTLLGKNFTPPDIHAKVTGAAKYSEDFRADGMVFLKTYPSPMPHAKVKSIDVSAAKKMPGVVGVMLPSEIKQPEDAGHAILTSYPVFVGQPILAVAAETEQQAEDAIQVVKVDLDPLPFVTDPLESLRPDGPNALVGGNVANRRGVELQQIKWTGKDFAEAGDDKLPMGKAVTVWSFGDLEAGFAKSKVVVEESFVSAANAHHAMEPRSAAAYWEGGKCHVWGSTQSSSFAVPSLAKYIGIKPTDLNLVSEFCGGGFGGKAYSYPLMALPALMSKKLNGRPVLMRVSRAEEFLNGSARAAFQGWVKIGFGANGRVLAVDSYIVQDNGSTAGFWDFQNFGMATSVILQPEAMRFHGIPVLTNTPPKGAQRGPGENQAANILEPLLDRGARELRIDRLALRLVNAPGGGPNGKIGPEQAPLTSAFLKEGLEQAAAKWGYAEKINQTGKQANGKIRSVGIGQAYHAAGYNGFDGMVRITPDGKLHIHTGVGNLGTYSYAATSRVSAEVLGYDWNNTVIERGGTLKAMPFNIGQFGSNTSFTMTRTNYAGAMDAKQKLLEIGATVLGGKADDYELKNERVVAKSGSGAISFADAAKKAIELGGKYSGHEVDEKLNPLTKAAVDMIKGTGLIGVAQDKLPKNGVVPALSAAFILIELDPETGKVDILDFMGVADVGQVLHPQGLDAQIRGGAVMGIGLAAMERYIYDPAYARPNAIGFYQAKPPTYLDVPAELASLAVEGAVDEQNPVGAKGIGEPVQGSASSAYLSAVSDALGGHMFNRVPVVADMIVNAVAKRPQSYKPLQVNNQ